MSFPLRSKVVSQASAGEVEVGAEAEAEAAAG